MASELDLRRAGMDLMKALNEATNSQGGFLVPEIWGQKLYELIVAKTTAIQLCEQIIMTTDTLYFPKVASASTAYFVGEDATITESEPTFSQVTLHPMKVAGLIQVSTEVMEDSNPSIMDAVMERLAVDIALKVDSEIYNGTTTTNGYLGFRNNALVSTVVVNGELTTDNISDAIEKLQSANIEPTDLVIHPKLLNKLRKLKTSTTSNEPLLNLILYGNPTLGNGYVGKIWGVNVITTTQLPVNLTSTVTGYTQSLTDAILVARGKCGIFARRREMTVNRFYVIDTDDWKIQANMRAAFTVNYEKAVCIIQGLATV